MEELENLLKVILNVDKNITVWQVNKVLRKIESAITFPYITAFVPWWKKDVHHTFVSWFQCWRRGRMLFNWLGTVKPESKYSLIVDSGAPKDTIRSRIVRTYFEDNLQPTPIGATWNTFYAMQKVKFGKTQSDQGRKNKDTGLDWFDEKWKSILVLNWTIKRSDCLINFHIQLKSSLRYVIVNMVLRYVD